MLTSSSDATQHLLSCLVVASTLTKILLCFHASVNTNTSSAPTPSSTNKMSQLKKPRYVIWNMV